MIMKNNIIFDLDGTLTESRSEITQRMIDALADLCLAGKQIAITSGASLEQMCKQIPFLMSDRWPFHVLPQSGNEYYYEGEKIWENMLSAGETQEIYRHIAQIQDEYEPLTEFRKDHRGSQIAYSLLGHDADKKQKKEFDPDGSRRRELLGEYPLKSRNIEVRIGGTTCLDYTKKGRNKGYYVKELARHNGWDLEECVYLGDALFKGGNDESVLGICDCIEVESPRETIEMIKMLAKHEYPDI